MQTVEAAMQSICYEQEVGIGDFTADLEALDDRCKEYGVVEIGELRERLQDELDEEDEKEENDSGTSTSSVADDQ
jgi:hypothetical protein